MSQMQSNEIRVPDSPATLGDHAPPPAAPAPAEPTAVVVGAGGDPLILGLPIFAVGALTLGMVLIGFLPATALGAIVPIVLFATGIFLAMVTAWSAMLGLTMVAGITGTFSGFWLSLAGLLLGLQHNWYGVATADVPQVEQMFFIAWGCLFLFLLVPSLRLPTVYPAIVGLVVAACAVAAAAIRLGNTDLLKASGYIILVLALLGFYAFVNVGLTAMGATRAVPPLGRPIVS
ncbi:MAG TPA: GPR1/FUN34/YaaH family transporter [Amycolatopsis sp.]|nr:GPR1/FUN34/YaaH family transporter [Amycolatopsis sp.]